MKPLSLLLALFIPALAFAQRPVGTVISNINNANQQTINAQKVFIATGTDDVPLVGSSESGASAGVFEQGLHFDSPAVHIRRTGTAGGATAETATCLISAGNESTASTPVLQIGGCLALSGDNWFITWGDGALSLPGGILDNPGKIKGHIAIDPVHRQLLEEDGTTPILTWTNGTIHLLSLITTHSAPASNDPGIPGQMIFTDTYTYRCFGSGDWRRAPVTYSTY